MIDVAAAQDRCAQLLAAAKRQGATSADAVASASSSEAVSIRLGKLEDVERSESDEIGLRVFVGRRSASISTSDFTAAAFEELATRAVAMAGAAPEDPYAGIAPPELLANGRLPVLDLADSAEPSPASLRAMAEETEDAARAVSGVTNSEGGSASFGRSVAALVTSNGFAQGYGATSHSLSASVIAGEGRNMQRDYAYRTMRHAADLPPAAEIGRRAGERAVARLNPGGLASGTMPVVFDPRVSSSLVGYVLGAISGTAIARRSSFLLNRLEEEIFASGIRILDNPHLLRGLRSRPFDGEGLPTGPRALVEGGRLTGWLTNLSAARQLGIDPTGHAARGGSGAPGISASNVHLEAGSVSRAELIADITEGVLVTELSGQGVNPVTGDYSRGASGFRIVNGEVAGPVAEFTIAGNLLTMMAALSAADDLEMHRAINVPTLRIDGMVVAGG
jgi:PmbA protein